MLVKDIDKKLDMRVVLRLRQETDFFTATKDLGMTLPAFIYGKEEQIWMSTFLPKSTRNQKIDIIKMKYKGWDL